MSLMQWSSELSVNISEIDTQHKKLLDLINALHAAMGSGKGKDILEDIFSELITYTKTHFSFEENLMMKHNYSDITSHKIAHKQLTEKVMGFYNEYKSGKIGLPVLLFSFLKDWLIGHISRSDKKYGPFLNARGVS